MATPDEPRNVSPVPFQSRPHRDDAAYAALLAARRDVVDAMLKADLAERDARAQRAHANRLNKQYERQLMEWNGQGTLPGT